MKLKPFPSLEGLCARWDRLGWAERNLKMMEKLASAYGYCAVHVDEISRITVCFEDGKFEYLYGHGHGLAREEAVRELATIDTEKA